MLLLFGKKKSNPADKRERILKKLAPIRFLSEEEFSQIDFITSCFDSDEVIFEKGQQVEKIYYLLAGSVEVKTENKTYLVTAGTALANLPLNGGQKCVSTVTTKEFSTLLFVPVTVVQWWINKSKIQSHSEILEEIFELNFPNKISDTLFFKRISRAYREKELNFFPLLPCVGLAINKKIEQLNVTSIQDIAEIIQIDASLVAKLISVSNSAVYAQPEPIKNCTDAISLLGIEMTIDLIKKMSVENLFQYKKTSELLPQVVDNWHKSLYVSSLCFFFATDLGYEKPEDALIAGLLCDIGVITLLHFAEQNPDSYSNDSDLLEVIAFLKPLIGALVLHNLGFTKEISEIPKYAENWHYESDCQQLTLLEIVILAKYHSYFATPKALTLPPISSLSIYNKMTNGQLNPDFSLNIFIKAKQRIDSAMSLLS